MDMTSLWCQVCVRTESSPTDTSVYGHLRDNIVGTNNQGLSTRPQFGGLIKNKEVFSSYVRWKYDWCRGVYILVDG